MRNFHGTRLYSPRKLCYNRKYVRKEWGLGPTLSYVCEVNAMSAIVNRTEELVLPICEEIGVELFDVEYVQEGRHFFLRVFVDTPEGIDIDQCALVAEKLSEQLDRFDYIPDEYMLEVSSPGAERPLKTKEAVAERIGSYVNVKTTQPVGGETELEGYLRGFSNEVLELEVNLKGRKKTFQIPYGETAKIRLAIKF